MCTHAQGDVCPAKCRWRPLFNAAKFGWHPLIECRAVILPRRKTQWNLLGWPKLVYGSQPSGILIHLAVWPQYVSPYCRDMCWRYCCLTSFFLIVDTCLSCEDIARQNCAMVRRWQFLGSCISSEPLTAISDLHSKFALRPHHVWKYGRHPISDRWD